MIRDWCEMNGIPRVSDLQPGMDFRRKEYRREVFLRFYEFHLRYKSHPGGVYYFIPFLSDLYNWDLEQRLWFATLNGMTQYPMTSLELFKRMPHPPEDAHEMRLFKEWFDKHWHHLPVDMDRRYQKKEIPFAMWTVGAKVREYGSLQELYTGDFSTLWKRAREELHSLGRLGAWSGLEFIKIAGRGEIRFEFDTLMLHDMSGSKSHRNGLCLVLGYDELDWHDKLNPLFDGKYTPRQIEWLEEQGEELLAEARARFKDKLFAAEVGYETLESTLCCYKSWHRPNRRYPNVYNDMAYGRIIESVDKNPDFDPKPFWKARELYLPPELRIEAQPGHPQYGSRTLSKERQNLYRETGRIHTMGLMWPCFER